MCVSSSPWYWWEWSTIIFFEHFGTRGFPLKPTSPLGLLMFRRNFLSFSLCPLPLVQLAAGCNPPKHRSRRSSRKIPQCTLSDLPDHPLLKQKWLLRVFQSPQEMVLSIAINKTDTSTQTPAFSCFSSEFHLQRAYEIKTFLWRKQTEF